MSHEIQNTRNDLATPKDIRRGCLVALLMGTLIYSVGTASKNESIYPIEQVRSLEELNKNPRYIIYKTVKKAKKVIYEYLTDRLFF